MGDWVSIVCETTTARTTARHPWGYPARCVLSAGLCGALSGKLYALCHGCITPQSPAPLGVAYRNGCPAFVCHLGSISRLVVPAV